MAIFLITFVFMLLIVAAMAIGVIFGRKPITGTCGGMSALGMDTSCEICGGDQSKCEEENALVKRAKTALAYDASKRL